MARQPAVPMAPPWTRGSLAKATAFMPSTWPWPARTPLSSAGSSSRRAPGSNSASSRAGGSRPGGGGAGDEPAGAGRASARPSTSVTSARGERERDVSPAEPERVVDDGHRRRRPGGQLLRLGGGGQAAPHVGGLRRDGGAGG